MIIFYNNNTGEITGTINGRIHSKRHLDMWIGERESTDRIICNWKPIQFYREDGTVIPDGSKEKPYAADFTPDHEQQDIFAYLDSHPNEYINYHINLNTKKLVKN